MGCFEWIGKTPEYITTAALPALALHRSIGPARKMARTPHIRGLRVSPNVYTTPTELTRFVDALVAAVRV